MYNSVWKNSYQNTNTNRYNRFKVTKFESGGKRLIRKVAALTVGESNSGPLLWLDSKIVSKYIKEYIISTINCKKKT